MTSPVELTQIIPAQPGIIARWHKPSTEDNPGPYYYTRPVAAWAITDSGGVSASSPPVAPTWSPSPRSTPTPRATS